ncbi:MAG: T9SS type A sorting domain-containing protein [Bacteroidota bacterium]
MKKLYMLLFLVAFMINSSWAQCNLTVNATPSVVCAGSCSSIHVSGAHTYLWAPGGMTDSIVSVCPSTTTTYTVTGTDLSSNTCSATTTITVNPKPILSPSATPSTICVGQTSTLSVSSSIIGTTYNWTPGSLSGTPLSVSPPSTTTYTVTGTASGCTGSASVTVTVNPNPVLTVTATPPTICSGATSVLSVTSTVIGTTYVWAPGPLYGTPVNVHPSPTTCYTVTGTSPYGCTGTANPCVYVNPIPTVTVPSNSYVCNGGTVPAATFTSSPVGATFTWTNTNVSIGMGASGTGGIPSFTATNTTTSPITATITVTPTLNGCVGTPASYTITVNPTDNPSFHYASSVYCTSGVDPTVIITGGSAGTFTVSPAGLVILNSATGLIDLSASSMGVYTITFVTNGMCPSYSTFSLTITGSPTATFNYSGPYCSAGLDPLPTFAPGSTAGTFSSSPAGLVFISTATGQVDLSASTPGTYTVTNSIPAGLCPAVYATNTITINSDYAFNVVPADITIFPGQCTPLSIATAGTYTWAPPTGLSDTIGANVTACPASTTTYTVMGTSTGGCTGTALATVQIASKYIHEVSGSTSCHLPYLAIFDIADAFVLPNDTIQYQFDYGDGTDTTFNLIFQSDPSPMASLSHAYTATGSYSPVAILQHTGGLADTIEAANLINLADTCGDISGKVFLDIDHNCSADSGEYLMVNKLVKLYNSSHVLVQAQYTDAAGFYSFDVSGGNYTLSIDSSIYSSYSLYCPSGGSYAVSTLPATGKNFGADCLGGFDLYGHITGSTFHPGQNTNMYLTVGNNNCTPENAVAKFVPDPLTSFVTSSVSPSAIIGDTVCFAVNNLSSVNNPFKTIIVNVLTSASAAAGDSLHFKLFIDPLTGDAVAANNTVIKKAIVTSSSKETWATSSSGSNSKEVDPSGDITATTNLTYTIYFQNQGSATVANLFVLDTLDENLDLNTLQLIAASHSYTSQILTSGTRKILKFLFANINLPDTSDSPLLSNGFVTYQITPLSTSPQGTTISNKANIFQDANPLIATNTVQNTIPGLTTDIEPEQQAVVANHIMPNPTSQMATLMYNVVENGKTYISLFNIAGKETLVLINTNQPKGPHQLTIDCSPLLPGIYFIRITTGNQTSVLKLVKI